MEALSDVGQMVGSSLVLDEVLSNIIKNAVRFAGCDGGSIMEYVEDEHCFSVRSAYASSPELLARLRTNTDRAGDHPGRPGRAGRPPDRRTRPGPVDLDPHLATAVRRRLAVRARRAGPPRRRASSGRSWCDAAHPESSPRRRSEFLETFASQSAMAVYNAQLFRELEQKSAELQVMSQHKSDFLASMSHELRTPLNAVIGFSEVLLERFFGELNDRQDEYLRDILGSGKHLLALLNEILDLSKVEAGRMELEIIHVLVAGGRRVRDLDGARAGGHGTRSLSQLSIRRRSTARVGRAATPAGPGQSAEQCGQVHARRRSGRRRRPSRSGTNW